jgi:hypothetical protein
MHLPVLTVLAGTVGGLRRFERILVNRFEGKIAKDVSDLAGADIVAFNLRQCLLDVATTKVALIIGKLDEDQFGALTSL